MCVVVARVKFCHVQNSLLRNMWLDNLFRESLNGRVQEQRCSWDTPQQRYLLVSRFYRVSALKNKNFTDHQWKCQDMNVIYSMIFWGNCLPKSILKQKAQNVRIAPTNQIFHTFTDKKIFFWNSHQVLIHFKVYRKFSFTQNQKLCKFFDLWVFVSSTTFKVEHVSRSDFF